jgi:hypothetical protein
MQRDSRAGKEPKGVGKEVPFGVEGLDVDCVIAGFDRLTSCIWIDRYPSRLSSVGRACKTLADALANILVPRI